MWVQEELVVLFILVVFDESNKLILFSKSDNVTLDYYSAFMLTLPST